MGSLKDKFKKESSETGINSTFVDYLDFSRCKSHELKRLKLEVDKDYVIGVLPFTIATDKCLVGCKTKRVYGEKGDKTYHALIYAHNYLRITTGSYICMKHTFGKSCPICDYYDKLRNEGGVDKEDIKHLYPTLRGIHLIIDKNDDKIKVLDISNNHFEEKWEPIRAEEENEGRDIFPVYMKEDWARYLKFTPKGKYKEPQTYFFKEIKDFDKDIAEHGISLDDLLVIPDTKHLQEIIDNIGEVEEDEEQEQEENNHKDYLKDAENIEDEEDKEEDEQPKKKKKVVENECPYGKKCVFGKDWDEYEVCDKCKDEYNDIYEACKKLSKEG